MPRGWRRSRGRARRPCRSASIRCHRVVPCAQPRPGALRAWRVVRGAFPRRARADAKVDFASGTGARVRFRLLGTVAASGTGTPDRYSGRQPDHLGRAGGERGVDAVDPQPRRGSRRPRRRSARPRTPARAAARDRGRRRAGSGPRGRAGASASSTNGSRATAPDGVRDRVAVRVESRAAEPGVDALQQPVADRVLEHLGLVVHLVPGVAELAHEPGLDEAVPAQHGQGALLAVLGEPHRTVRHVRDEAGRRRASSPSRSRWTGRCRVSPPAATG